METFECAKCLVHKLADDFYKNSLKRNGLESHCKTCVLKRKSKKYKQTKITLKKSKLLRAHRKVKVLDVQRCTFKAVLINRPSESEVSNALKELVEGVLCYQNIQCSKELAMAV